MSKKTKSLREYFSGIDFDIWWDEFSSLHNKNGTLLYPTIWSFIQDKAKSSQHRSFLWWILGPKADTSENKEFDKFKQRDWENKRERKPGKKVLSLESEITRCFSSLDELRALGKVNLDEVVKIKGLIEQLDFEYSGQLNLSNLTAKQNANRLNTYLRQREALLDQLHSAQQMFAKTRGVDLANLESILAVIGPSVLGKLAQETTDPKEQATQDAMKKLTAMMIKKAAAYSMPLPDLDAEKIIKDSDKTITIPKSKLN